jgi:hypothetical protein
MGGDELVSGVPRRAATATPAARRRRARRGDAGADLARTPWRSQRGDSSIERPKIDGSPPFSRTTRSPAQRAFDQQRVDRRPDPSNAGPNACRRHQLGLGLGDTSTPGPDQRIVEDDLGRAISRSALRVSRSGSPGPAPTSQTGAGAMSSAAWTASFGCRAAGEAGRHDPQLVPAPKRRADGGDVGELLSAIALTIVFSPTSKQTQTIGPRSSARRGRGRRAPSARLPLRQAARSASRATAGCRCA